MPTKNLLNFLNRKRSLLRENRPHFGNPITVQFSISAVMVIGTPVRKPFLKMNKIDNLVNLPIFINNIKN